MSCSSSEAARVFGWTELCVTCRGFVVAPCRLESGLRAPTDKGIDVTLHLTEMIHVTFQKKIPAAAPLSSEKRGRSGV